MAETKKKSRSNKTKQVKRKKYKIKFEKKFIVICSTLAGIFALFIGILVILNLDFWVIKTITVDGNKHYSYDEIVQCLDIPYEQNIFKYNLSKAKENIESLPYINKVKLIRKLPSEIQVKVEERNSTYIAYVKDNNIYVLLDQNGVILSEISLSERNDEILIFGLNFVDHIVYGEELTDLEKDKLNRFITVYETYMANNVGKDITSVSLTQSNVVLTLNNVLDIKLNYSGNLSYKMSLLKSILKQIEGKSGSVDMTQEDPIYSVY